MGIFDIIELKNHCQAIGEYLLYVDKNPEELQMCSNLMSEHLKKMFTLLDRMEKLFIFAVSSLTSLRVGFLLHNLY